jgi:sulfate adenylyltransferase subunit 1 (EFTu-like GTPase family)
LSALRGDNVVTRSEKTPWYHNGQGGETLMEMLESVQITHDVTLDAFRLPVQFVNPPNLDFRGFCGTVASGQIRQGDHHRVAVRQAAVVKKCAHPGGRRRTVRLLVRPSPLRSTVKLIFRVAT